MSTLGNAAAVARIADLAAAKQVNLQTCGMDQLLVVANAILAFSAVPTPLPGPLTVSEIERKHLVRTLQFAMQALDAVPLSMASPGALPRVQASSLRALVEHLLLPMSERVPRVQTPQ